MSILELRNRTKKKLDALAGDDVRAAADFVDFLAERSGADSPLPKRPAILQRLKRGRREYLAGAGTRVSKLKRKY